jgi:alpha-tubulin suppressor-like RCC1 family protein
MSKVGFMQDILRGVKKVLGTEEEEKTSKPTGKTGAAPGIESLMKRGHLFLEDSDWKQANEYFDKVLDIDPEYAPAYVGNLCAELEIQQEKLLEEREEPLDKHGNFQKALRFADTDYRTKLDEINEINKEYIANLKQQEQERIAEKARKEQQRILELKKIREHNTKYNGCIFVSDSHVVGLKRDGTVVTAAHEDTGKNTPESNKNKYVNNTDEWHHIVAVSASGSGNTVGLKTDGTVVATGNNDKGQCNTDSWQNIVAISAESKYTVGLKADGMIVAAGSYPSGYISEWRDIIAVSTSYDYIVGLKADGTVVAIGKNDKGQCDTGDWRDIVAISAGGQCTVGLKADGTVVAAGSYPSCYISEWRDIVAVSVSYAHIVGLKADGTVVATGNNDRGQCNTDDWRDIVAISSGGMYTAGLKADGTVKSVGEYSYKENIHQIYDITISFYCRTYDWQDIGPFDEALSVLGEKKTKEAIERREAIPRNYKRKENQDKARGIIGPILQLVITALVFFIFFSGLANELVERISMWANAEEFAAGGLLLVALPLGLPSILMGIVAVKCKKASGVIGLISIIIMDISLSVFFANGFWGFIGYLLIFSISAIPGAIMAGFRALD